MPVVVSHLEHATVMVSGREKGQPRVEPLLAHVHTKRIVLQCTNTQRTHLLLISLYHHPYLIHSTSKGKAKSFKVEAEVGACMRVCGIAYRKSFRNPVSLLAKKLRYHAIPFQILIFHCPSRMFRSISLTADARHIY